MSKIICDICGTTYQDTAECCPICGCTNDAAAAMLGDELLLDDVLDEPKAKAGRFSNNKKKREIFDFDEVNSPAAESVEEGNPYEDEEEEYQEPPRHNTGVVILLTALIALLLVAAGFLFIRFYLPNAGDKETVPQTVAQAIETTAETTDPTIPCQGLVLSSGGANLVAEGQKFLLNVVATPVDTTDKIVYQSADESVATVDESGLVVAVGEGETVINITCGPCSIPCPVVCKFTPETEPPTEATTVATEAAETQETEPKPNPDVVLKLKKTDVRLRVYLEFQLMLDCDLEQNQVEWSSEHPHIAKVDEEGNVTAVKSGTTSITAKYGDQEVSCIVRCYN